jgi:hypothetical protein
MPKFKFPFATLAPKSEKDMVEMIDKSLAEFNSQLSNQMATDIFKDRNILPTTGVAYNNINLIPGGLLWRSANSPAFDPPPAQSLLDMIMEAALEYETGL